MPNLPQYVENYLRNEIEDRYSPAFIRFDKDYRVAEWGGMLIKYGIKNIEEGARAESVLLLLEGIIPFKEEKIVLKTIEIIPGVYTDAHLLKTSDSFYVIFIDVSRQVYLNRKFQQKHNELKLEYHKYIRKEENRLSNDILAKFDIVLMRWIDEDFLIMVAEKPSWFEQIFPDNIKRLKTRELKKRMPSLSTFLDNSQDYWQNTDDEPEMLELEHNVEKNGAMIKYSVQTLTVDGRKFIALRKIDS